MIPHNVFQWFALLPDLLKIKRQYRKETGKLLNLKNPQRFNEKIQWIKLYWRDPLMTICADKVRARDYVAQIAGFDVLNEIYGSYENVDEIDIDSLPERFVLKANHSSGHNVFCLDRDTFEWDQVKIKLKEFLRFNHYRSGREWAYKNIPRRILCEKYMEENGTYPRDYKFFCFQGEPQFIQVDIDRFGNHQRNLYDLDWNLLEDRIRWPQSTEWIEQPRQLAAMILLARKLSAPFPFVRVDLYCLHDAIRFGEMTFYPGGGLEQFIPDDLDYYYGSKLILPSKIPQG